MHCHEPHWHWLFPSFFFSYSIKTHSITDINFCTFSHFFNLTFVVDDIELCYTFLDSLIFSDVDTNWCLFSICERWKQFLANIAKIKNKKRLSDVGSILIMIGFNSHSNQCYLCHQCPDKSHCSYRRKQVACVSCHLFESRINAFNFDSIKY